MEFELYAVFFEPRFSRQGLGAFTVAPRRYEDAASLSGAILDYKIRSREFLEKNPGAILLGVIERRCNDEHLAKMILPLLFSEKIALRENWAAQSNNIPKSGPERMKALEKTALEKAASMHILGTKCPECDLKLIAWNRALKEGKIPLASPAPQPANTSRP